MPEREAAQRRTWALGPVLSALSIAVFMTLIYVAVSEQPVTEWIGQSPVTVAVLSILLLVADILVPVPSTVVILFAGEVLGAVGGVIVGTVGLSLGCALGYWIGRFIPGRALRLVDPERHDRVTVWLRGRGGIQLLAVLRPVPILGETSVIVAGLLHLDVRSTLAVTSLSNLALAIAYVAVGQWAESWGGFVVAILAAWAVPGIATLAFWGIRTAVQASRSRSQAGAR